MHKTPDQHSNTDVLQCIRGDDGCSALRCDRFEQIIPIWVLLFDEFDLPGSAPFLESLLSGNGKLDAFERLEINKSCGVVFFRYPVDCMRAVFVRASNQIIGDAGVKRSTLFVCHYVNEVDHDMPREQLLPLPSRRAFFGERGAAFE